MAAKKRTNADRELKSEIKRLKAKLKRADARADRWKGKARRAKKADAASQTRVRKLTKRLDKAATRSTPPPVAHTSLAASARSITPGAAPRTGETTPPITSPDSTWTVLRLREEARTRGLTGITGKTKAQLLALLT